MSTPNYEVNFSVESFNIGDKVKIINGPQGEPLLGKTGTVHSMKQTNHGTEYKLELDDDPTYKPGSIHGWQLERSGLTRTQWLKNRAAKAANFLLGGDKKTQPRQILPGNAYEQAMEEHHQGKLRKAVRQWEQTEHFNKILTENGKEIDEWRRH